MISHEHKVIFIHIPKTGGQSIEQMFLDDLGLNWQDRAPLLLRANSDPAQGPSRLAHLYADEYVRLGHISQNDFDSYYKFAVVRDPYARALSEYLYRMQRYPWHKQTPSWRFVRQHHSNDYEDVARHMSPQTRYVMDENGRVLVDRIVRFENMNAEIPILAERFFGERRPLPHRNKSKGSSRRLSRKEIVRYLIKGSVAR